MILIFINFSISYLTHQLALIKNLSYVSSSIIVTLVSYPVILMLNNSSYENTFLLSMCFGASFIGMTNEKFTSIYFFIICSFIYTQFFLFLSPLLKGIGGSLGFTAFISTLFSKVLLEQLVFAKNRKNSQ